MGTAERAERAAQIGPLISAWLAGSKRDLAGRTETPVVGLYWPIRGEPDLTGFYAQWITAGWTIGLPRTPLQPGPLSFLRYEPGTPLLTDSFGVSTPDTDDVVTPDRIIAPCVGYGQGGYRLGYGGGYYDRTLAGLAGVAVGIAFHETRVPGIEAQTHDQPMAGIITDTGWVY